MDRTHFSAASFACSRALVAFLSVREQKCLSHHSLLLLCAPLGVIPLPPPNFPSQIHLGRQDIEEPLLFPVPQPLLCLCGTALRHLEQQVLLGKGSGKKAVLGGLESRGRSYCCCHVSLPVWSRKDWGLDFESHWSWNVKCGERLGCIPPLSTLKT